LNHAEICNGSGGYEDSELATFIPALFSREIVKKTLSIPTIDDNATDFDILFNLWNQTNNDNMDVTFEFSNCNFLRQNAIAFLGGLIRLIQSKGGTVWFNLESISKTVKANLERNGFIPTLGLGNGSVPKTGNSIPYREDSYQDKDVVVDYLKMYWLGQEWVHVSEMLKDAIVGTVWEIYANAFEHGKSSVRIFSCGQHYPHRHELKLTVVDFGAGIPSNVRLFFEPDPRAQSLNAASCLKWAFQRGNTTKPDGRGLGLDLLKEFVKLNKGKLEIFSHEGYVIIDNKQEKFANKTTFFEGTLVNITFICDESHYRLVSEMVEEPLF